MRNVSNELAHLGDAELNNLVQFVIEALELPSKYRHIDAAIAAAAGVCYKECRFVLNRERGYSRTSNEQIRDVFSKTKRLADATLNKLKSDDYSFFNFVYDGVNGNVKGTADGFNFRGGGLVQLTGRYNYNRVQSAVAEAKKRFPHPSLDTIPNLLTDESALMHPIIGPRVAAFWYSHCDRVAPAGLVSHYGPNLKSPLSLWSAWFYHALAGWGHTPAELSTGFHVERKAIALAAGSSFLPTVTIIRKATNRV